MFSFLYIDAWSAEPAGPALFFFWTALSMNIEKRCNHYRLIVGCKLAEIVQ